MNNQRQGRMTWIKDIIKYVENAPYIARKSENEKFDIFYPNDSQFSRMITEKGYAKKDLILCPFAISLGNAGCSALDPFETVEAALDWIENNQDGFYFVRRTNSELIKRFPNIPVCMHPKEVEESFGIFEK